MSDNTAPDVAPAEAVLTNPPAVRGDNPMSDRGIPLRSLADAERLAHMMADSQLVPKVYQGQPANCLIAMQMGAEIGLGPMQSLQNIAVVNGTPSIWGDAIGALIKSHPLYEWIEESWDSDSQTAHCTLKRRGEPARSQSFGIADARAAGLDSKDTYKRHLRRMCERRARGRCAQDVFPDALKGLVPAEEAMDYATRAEPEPPARASAPLAERLDAGRAALGGAETERQGAPESGSGAPDSEALDPHDIHDEISGAKSFEQLNAAIAKLRQLPDSDTRAELQKHAGNVAKALRANAGEQS